MAWRVQPGLPTQRPACEAATTRTAMAIQGWGRTTPSAMQAGPTPTPPCVVFVRPYCTRDGWVLLRRCTYTVGFERAAVFRGDGPRSRALGWPSACPPARPGRRRSCTPGRPAGRLAIASSTALRPAEKHLLATVRSSSSPWHACSPVARVRLCLVCEIFWIWVL